MAGGYVSSVYLLALLELYRIREDPAIGAQAYTEAIAILAVIFRRPAARIVQDMYEQTTSPAEVPA